MAGFDTASTVTSGLRSAAGSAFGKPAFWIRYFSPCCFTAVNSSSSNANAECEQIWSSGGHYLGCVSTPTQSRLSGSSAEGRADAVTFVNAMISVYDDVGPLLLPSNGILYCWLDQEAATSLSLAYWNGWAGYLNGYEFNGAYPFFPGLYCNPNSAPPNCSIVDSASASYCWGVWSSEYQVCKNSVSSPPAWDSESCAVVATKLWQYADQGVCFSNDVDLDLGASGFNTASYCFNVSSNP
jgi:hypothetical protein